MLTRCERLEEAVAATEKGCSLLPEGDGFDLETPAALDLAMLHRRLGHLEQARHWALRALEACSAIGELDPVRARILRSWIQQELGFETTPSTMGSVEISPSFLQIEGRRLLTTQISEIPLG